MKQKKIVKRNLPIDKYEVVDTFSLSEGDVQICENCGKAIKNIAVVRNSKNETFNIGLDCAETLTGITESDIEYWSSSFGIAKTIRAKVRKYKKQGAFVKVENYFLKPEAIDICFFKNEKCEKLITWEEVGIEVLKKYLPDLAMMAKINTSFSKINERDFDVVNGGTYNGYTFRYEIRGGDPFKYAYAEIWKDGEMLKSGSNGGHDIRSCMIECGRLYNAVEYEAGLRPLI